MTLSSAGAADWATGGFVSQVLWVDTDNQYVTGNYWVELGYTKGWEGQNILTFYWADQRPNGGGYHEHRISSVPAVVGDTHTTQIDYIGNNQWNVVIDGSLIDTSVANPGGSHAMSTGLETTSQKSYFPNGDSHHLEHKANGSWNTDWGSSTYLVNTDPPCTHVSWVTTDQVLADSLTGCG